MELDIPDTSSDSSNDETIICNDDEFNDDVAGPSSTTESELDRLFKKYLSDDFCNKYIPKEQTTKVISESNNEFSNSGLPKISKCSSSEKIGDYSKTSLSDIDKKSQYELDSFPHWDLPSCSISESNNEFSNCEIAKISKCSSSEKIGDNSKTSLSGIDKKSKYELDSFADLDLPSCSISESNNEFSNSELPKISKCSSSEKVDNCSKTSLSGIGKKSQYELDSFSDSDLPSCSQIKRLKTVDSRESHAEVIPIIRLSSSSDETESSTEYLNKKCSNKEKKKIDQEKKQKEKELKKEEERKNKALKNALASHFKNMKPENCLKFIKTHIDLEISRKDFLEDIVNELQNNGVSFTVETQLAKSSISWTRQIDSHLLDINGKLIDTSKGLKIEEILIMVECIDFLNHVHNQTFSSYIENLYTTLVGKKIILLIYGLERYYRFQKNKKNQNFAKEVFDKNRKITDQKLFENIPTVSRRTVEYALTEIQLLYSISHRLLETKKELALFVFQITKSIAQLPHKLQKQEKFLQSTWFMSESNKNCIMVDKNGNGLSRLWKQIITTFPMTTLETAEAICLVYPTPSSLYKAYDNITNSVEGEKLLQDIPIRRTAGPIGTMRKIGPELSKKFYYLFTSLDPDKIL